jgi:hypothetical protein
VGGAVYTKEEPNPGGPAENIGDEVIGVTLAIDAS